MAESVPFLPLSSTHEKIEVGYDDETLDTTTKNRRSYSWPTWKDFALIFMTIWAIVFGSLSASHWQHRSSSIGSIMDPNIARETLVENRWISEYASRTAAGMDDVDQHWDAIRPVHGIVAVDHGWAARNGLPSSDSLKADDSKGVYTIAAYHSLHCLTIVRKTLFQLARGQQLDVPFGHSTHCLESLRQDIVCSADDTMFYHAPNTSAGDGQMRKCRNWASLRDWASENSACYTDTKQAVSHEDSEHCDSFGSDGIVLWN